MSKKNVKKQTVNNAKIIIWGAAALLLTAAIIIVAVALSRRDDEPPVTPAVFSLEEEFIRLRGEGVIANYYIANAEELSFEQALIEGFDGRIVYSISGYKDEANVTVHELRTEEEAARALELLRPTLISGAVARVSGKLLIFGTEALVAALDV